MFTHDTTSTSNATTYTHTIKVMLMGGGVERIHCVSRDEAMAKRNELRARGGINCFIIGTCEEVAELDRTFKD